jgi:hypothetical protein
VTFPTHCILTPETYFSTILCRKTVTLNTNGKIKPKTSAVNLLDCKELKTRRDKIKHK